MSVEDNLWSSVVFIDTDSVAYNWQKLKISWKLKKKPCHMYREAVALSLPNNDGVKEKFLSNEDSLLKNACKSVVCNTFIKVINDLQCN